MSNQSNLVSDTSQEASIWGTLKDQDTQAVSTNVTNMATNALSSLQSLDCTPNIAKHVIKKYVQNSNHNLNQLVDVFKKNNNTLNKSLLIYGIIARNEYLEKNPIENFFSKLADTLRFGSMFQAKTLIQTETNPETILSAVLVEDTTAELFSKCINLIREVGVEVSPENLQNVLKEKKTLTSYKKIQQACLNYIPENQQNTFREATNLPNLTIITTQDPTSTTTPSTTTPSTKENSTSNDIPQALNLENAPTQQSWTEWGVSWITWAATPLTWVASPFMESSNPPVEPSPPKDTVDSNQVDASDSDGDDSDEEFFDAETEDTPKTSIEPNPTTSPATTAIAQPETTDTTPTTPNKTDPNFKNFDLLPNETDKKNITNIISKTADSWLTSLNGLKTELKTNGKNIEHLHTLRFLEAVFNDPSLKSKIKIIKERNGGVVWNGAFGEAGFSVQLFNNLQAQKDLGNLTDEQIKNFARSIGIESQSLIQAASKNDWAKFIDILIEEKSK